MRRFSAANCNAHTHRWHRPTTHKIEECCKETANLIREQKQRDLELENLELKLCRKG